LKINDKNMKTDVFDIKGMSCSACVAHVDKATRKLDGIVDVQVNLLTNSMSIKYDESVLDVAAVEDAVKDAGYEATARIKSEADAQTDTQLKKKS
jgi:Cu+-exporting ATPase